MIVRQCTYVNAVFRFMVRGLCVFKVLAWGHNVKHIKYVAVKMLNYPLAYWSGIFKFQYMV